MEHERQRYVNGAWVDPLQPTLLDVVDPSTEEAFTKIAVGGSKDVDRAVVAAKAAFPARRARTGWTFCAPFCPSITSGARTLPRRWPVKWAHR